MLLVIIGILGVTHLLGRISGASFFHPPYWINWFHLCFGTIVLLIGLSRLKQVQAGLVLCGAIVATTIGLLGLLLGSWASRHYNVPELADPSDHAAHLAVGLAAIWACRNRRLA